jgi:endonuclease/exonuclease/phosphatase family metal-dependent hydrolase
VLIVTLSAKAILSEGVRAGRDVLGERGLRVATLNVWCRHGDWPARRQALARGFDELGPDLIALQETIVDGEGDQVREILGDAYHVAHQRERDTKGMGVSIASRWPIERVQELDLHVTALTAEFPCATLAAEIEVPAPFGPVLFVNHFPSWQLQLEHEREEQAVTAARFVEPTAIDREAHVILAGDLDAEPAAASIRFWTGRQSLDGTSVCYRDAWEARHPGEDGHTYGVPENPLRVDWDWPFRRIDYILVRCGLHGGPSLPIRSCARIFDAPRDGVWASDHFGVTADLFPPPPDPVGD